MNACAKFTPPTLGSYRDALQTALSEMYRVREYRDSSYSHQYHTSSILSTTFLFLTPEHLKHKCFSLVIYHLDSVASQSLKLSTRPNSMIPRTKRTRQLVITTSSCRSTKIHPTIEITSKSTFTSVHLSIISVNNPMHHLSCFHPSPNLFLKPIPQIQYRPLKLLLAS